MPPHEAQYNTEKRKLTTVNFIRLVLAVYAAVTFPVEVDALAIGALELAR